MRHCAFRRKQHKLHVFQTEAAGLRRMNWLFSYLFIHSLFNVSTSVYTAPELRKIDVSWIGKDVEGNGSSLIWGTLLSFSWKDSLRTVGLLPPEYKLEAWASLRERINWGMEINTWIPTCDIVSGMDSSGSGYAAVKDSYEHGNEPSGSLKYWEILE
jgi:hypothetical protein